MNDAPDGRLVHHWRGRDRQQDINALADAIASATELFNHNGTLVRLDGGELVPVNFADFRARVGQRICSLRLMRKGTQWRKEYYSFDFAPVPPSGPRTNAMGLQRTTTMTEPDDKVLRQIYTEELLWRLPRVIE
jgi:hypothetical protein